MQIVRQFCLAIFVFALCALPLFAQTQSQPAAAQTAPNDLKQLFDQRQWDEILRRIPSTQNQSPDADYYRGMALAALRRYDEASAAFLAGQQLAPRDIRFPEELAGVAFQTKNYAAAKRHLRRAIRLSPHDYYSTNFLATIYFLDGNLDAALKYWNRTGKPIVDDLTFSPPPRLTPSLLDHTFPFSLHTQWTLAQLQSARARADALQLFLRYRFDLQARPDGDFDLSFDFFPRPRFAPTHIATWLQFLRGLPYLTIYPSFYDLNDEARNVETLYRWDKEKRRLAMSFESPWRDHPEALYKIYFDARNENWDVSHTLFPSAARPFPPAAFNLEKLQTGLEFHFTQNGKLTWTTNLDYTIRRYRYILGGASTLPLSSSPTHPLFPNASALEYRARADYLLLSLPEHRFTLTSALEASAGKTFADGLGTFATYRGDVRSDWLPQSRGDDYRFQWRVRSGGISGNVPFDRLNILGFERDNDLWLRAHIGTADGKKGSAPIGRDFLLSNAELDKNLYSNGVITVKAGPFLDTGKVTAYEGLFGSQKWLWDTGLQTKIGVLGLVQVVLVYGKDLRNGNNTFYGTALQ